MMSDKTAGEKIRALLKTPKTFDEGFRLLIETYQERLYRHIRRMVIQHEDANDLLQETLIKVYRNIPDFRWESNLYTWMHSIATNEVRTFLRKQKKRPRTTEPEEIARLLAADNYFDGDQLQTALQKAILTLPEKQKLVFNMRYFECMSYQDMSAILKTSEGALKASFHHAVKKIEQYFKKTDL